MNQTTKNIFFNVQKYLYQTLADEKVLSSDLKIFNQVPKNTTFPYMYFGKFKLINRSTKGKSLRFHWINEIHLSSQNYGMEQILDWCNSIKNALLTTNVCLEGVHITAIELIDMVLDTMQDGKTTQVIFKFRIIAEEEDGLLQWILDAA